MSTYLPPIVPESVYTLRIQRYDPERDPAPRWETYRVPWVPTMTVIEALEWLWDEGVYVAFRANCREFTCGSCAMRIDGRSALACDTLLNDNTRLEPLQRYPIKRDLVVDTARVREKWRELELWPSKRVPDPPPRIENVPRSTLDQWHRSYARCIECYACLDACPVSASDSSAFSGPMWMLQIARAGAHPLDEANRIEEALEQGIGRCVSCYECAEVCPVAISPINEIQSMRRRILRHTVRRWFSKLGLGREPLSSDAVQRESP